ncbi:M4 family metallopeptidase [Geothrix paludis]|uniref:M4 family metallopeptidase n=1 Tax=Geothrix paludis TaxID=2922722 RepID=UPI001FAD8074|nr:M4 family metallopeptidase [Geothrix paludis]
MAISTGRTALSFLTAALAAGSLSARLPQDSPRADAAAQHLLASRAQLGLDADHAFLLRGAHADQLGQSHAHFQQTYKGVKVWGGDAITHTAKNGSELPLTNALLKGIQLNVTPSLDAAEALAVVQSDLAPKGAYAYAPTTELVVYPEMAEVVRAGRAAADLNAEDVSREVLRYALAYHVHTELENDQDGIKHTDYLVDAHNGAILKSWNTLHTTAATGTGNSQYNGTVSLPANYTGSTYELRDTTRGSGGSFGNNVVTNMAHASTSSTATGTIYTDADNTWGDGANYVEGGSTTAANGETAAVDAMFGMIKSWDFYKNVFSRNGIDGSGTATYSRVHIGNGYDNAFWSDSCFCMTYGDGTSFTTLTALDVAGHEMSHGVCARTANLTYSGESGGLNESNSDIFGTMIEFYARGGSGSTIGSTGGNWTIGEQLATNPLRWMYKPSLDGSSPDAWSSTIGNLDVHYSSGPMNRCFYFLSQGATTSGNTSTTYLPNGMTGIGNDAAARIWFRALTVYMTSSTNYAGARTAAISAAKDLYGAGSAQEQAVWNAFHGINVGSAWTSGSGDTTAPTVSVTESGTSGTITFTATASDNVGVTKVEFYVDGALKGTDTATPWTLSFDSTTLTNGSHNLVAKAYDAAGNVGTSTTVAFSVSNTSGGGTELVLNGGFESGATSWTQTTGVIGTYTGEPAHGGSYDAWMCGYGSAHTDYIYQQIAIPSTATGTLTFWLHVDTAETTTTTAYDTMKVQVLNTSGTVLATLATYSNLDKGTGYTQKSLSLSAYKGQTIRLRFYSVEDSSLQTSFVVDDVSVK